MKLKMPLKLAEKTPMNGCEALAIIYNLAHERYPIVAKETLIVTISLALSALTDQGLPITAENLEREFVKQADDYLIAAGKKSVA